MSKLIFFLVFLALISTLSHGQDKVKNGVKRPRAFAVSTSISTTTTIFTSTTTLVNFCYANAANTCKKKKKKSLIIDDPVDNQQVVMDPDNHSRARRSAVEEVKKEVEATAIPDEREGRQDLFGFNYSTTYGIGAIGWYFMTTTSISVQTSTAYATVYTATYSVSLHCTPAKIASIPLLTKSCG